MELRVEGGGNLDRPSGSLSNSVPVKWLAVTMTGCSSRGPWWERRWFQFERSLGSRRRDRARVVIVEQPLAADRPMACCTAGDADTHTHRLRRTHHAHHTHTHTHTHAFLIRQLSPPLPPPLPDGCRFFFSFVSLFFPVFFLRPLFFSAALSFHWGAPAINRCQNRSAAHPLPNPRSPPTRPPSFVHPLSSRFTRCRLFFYAFPSLCGTVRTIWKKYWKLHFYQAFEFLVWILNFLFHFNVLLHFILDI